MGCSTSKPKVKHSEPYLNNPMTLRDAVQPKPEATSQQVANCSDVDTESEHEQESAPPPSNFFNTNLAWANTVWTAPAMNVVEDETEHDPPAAPMHSRSSSDASSVAAGGPNPFSTGSEPAEQEDAEENFVRTHVNYNNMVWKHAIHQPDAYVPLAKPASKAASTHSRQKPASKSKQDVVQPRDTANRANATPPARQPPSIACNSSVTAPTVISNPSGATGSDGSANSRPRAQSSNTTKPASQGLSQNEMKVQQSAGRSGPSMKDMRAQQSAATTKPASSVPKPSPPAVPASSASQQVASRGGPSLAQIKQQQAAGRGGPSLREIKSQQDALTRGGNMGQFQQQSSVAFHANRPVAVASF